MSHPFVIPGPPSIIMLGVDVPTLSVLFGVGGIALGQLIAPPPALPIGWRRRTAMLVALALAVVAFVIATGQLPLVALGWGLGLGFSGITVFETLGTQVSKGIRGITDAFIANIAGRISGKGNDK